jgi:hypothetical protein
MFRIAILATIYVPGRGGQGVILILHQSHRRQVLPHLLLLEFWRT